MTWRELIEQEMKQHGESFDDVVGSTLSDNGLDEPFTPGSSIVEGVSFTLWTEDRVYFPTRYDGSEGVGSVPRDPNDEATSHIGG